MNIDSIMFIDNLKSLDLHGYDRETARMLIIDFIKENKKLKNEFVVIIHGIGSGIIRNITKETLTKNKDVLKFKIFPYNVGCTVVQINLTK